MKTLQLIKLKLQQIKTAREILLANQVATPTLIRREN